MLFGIAMLWSLANVNQVLVHPWVRRDNSVVLRTGRSGDSVLGDRGGVRGVFDASVLSDPMPWFTEARALACCSGQGCFV